MLYYKEDYVYFSKIKKNQIVKQLQFAFRIFQVKNIKDYKGQKKYQILPFLILQLKIKTSGL